MKSIWNGSLSFGLVSIPVHLYPSAQEHVLGFKMLHDTCKTPLHMMRWCNHCNQEVSWENVVKGIEISKGNYFVLTQEAVKALKPKKSDTIAIIEFVDVDLIDPTYRNTNYFVAPSSAQRAFTLFQHALGSSDKAAIGSLVMRDREHVCMIQNHYDGLLLTTLFYDYELRSPKNIPELKEKQPTITSNELKLAQQLIDQLTVKKFDISDFKDTFAQELKKLIKAKAAGKTIKIEKAGKTKKISSKENLLDVLKASVSKERPAKRVR